MAIDHRASNLGLAGFFLLAAAALSVAAMMPRSAAAASVEQTLYSFCSQTNCADGNLPQAGLIMDGAGNLYGTTRHGDENPGTCPLAGDCGVVFELTPDPTGTAWTETVLYRFCSQTRCPDGVYPYGGLIMDASGNLYGTTLLGGNFDSLCSGGVTVGCGTVFALNLGSPVSGVNKAHPRERRPS